jgi:putative Holliday junction resolvase
MKHLAIDFGLRRIGLALCDATESIVSPFQTIERRSDEQAAEAIAEVIATEGVDAVVVGLPLNMADDSEGPQAKRTRQFAALLAARIDVPVHMQNEQLSSFGADGRLADRELTNARHKARRDAVAAAIILEDFLRARRADD